MASSERNSKIKRIDEALMRIQQFEDGDELVQMLDGAYQLTVDSDLHYILGEAKVHVEGLTDLVHQMADCLRYYREQERDEQEREKDPLEGISWI